MTIELAVCLPTLVFTFLAAIQAADMIFLKQTLQVASYEAARAAIKRDATNDQALTSGQQILTNRNVGSFTITFLPTDIGSAGRGELVSVTVQAPADSEYGASQLVSFEPRYDGNDENGQGVAQRRRLEHTKTIWKRGTMLMRVRNGRDLPPERHRGIATDVAARCLS